MHIRDIQRRQITDLFDETYNDLTVIRDMQEEVLRQKNELSLRQEELKEKLATLVALVTTDRTVFKADENYKIELIRLFKHSYDCGLREAKDVIEEYIYSNRIPF